MKEKVKQPFVRFVRRENVTVRRTAAMLTAAILFALVLGAVLLAFNGTDPFSFYWTVISGNFANAIAFRNLIRAIVPLLITSLGIAVAFKLKFWNIGAEGQFMMGAFFAMTASLLLGNALPSFLTVVLVALIGGLGGALFGGIVGFFKVKFGTNETLLTLMFNYIAQYFVAYLLNVDFYRRPGGGIPVFKSLPTSAWLSEIRIGNFSFDTALIVALVLVAGIFLYFKYTKHGYEIAVVGDSPNTALYAGMNVKKITLRTVLLSAFLVGLAGALQLQGPASGHTMSTGITGGMGWTGIIIAWLCRLNPFGILLGSSLMGILERGCEIARLNSGVSAASADILQGIILFSVLAFDLFIRFKPVFRKKTEGLKGGPDEAAGQPGSDAAAGEG